MAKLNKYHTSAGLCAQYIFFGVIWKGEIRAFRILHHKYEGGNSTYYLLKVGRDVSIVDYEL